jgi:hypothetical protein
MPDFLFELFSEEIFARMQPKVADGLLPPPAREARGGVETSEARS